MSKPKNSLISTQHIFKEVSFFNLEFERADLLAVFSIYRALKCPEYNDMPPLVWNS